MLLETTTPEVATMLQKIGAGAFGAVVGWYVYYINRWRKDESATPPKDLAQTPPA